MTELWAFIREKALSDPAYYQVYRLYESGRNTSDECVLALLKFLTEQRDNLFQAVLKHHLTTTEPVLSVPVRTPSQRTK